MTSVMLDPAEFGKIPQSFLATLDMIDEAHCGKGLFGSVLLASKDILFDCEGSVIWTISKLNLESNPGEISESSAETILNQL